MDVPITPWFDRVLVMPIEESEMTSGGIVKPDVGLEAPVQGRVLGAGPECKHAQVGDLVAYGKYSGTIIKVEIEESEIVAPPSVLSMNRTALGVGVGPLEPKVRKYVILREDEIFGRLAETAAKVSLA